MIMGIWDTILGGAINFATSAYNQKAQKEENELQREFAASQQEDAQEFNALEAQKNRDFQSAEAALTRDFNSLEAQKNRDFQSAEAEAAYDRQVDFYEHYQSIGAQMRQYEENGLNPALLAGGVSVGSTPSSSTAQGSFASASSANGSMASSGAIGSSVSSLPGIISLAEGLLSVEQMKSVIQNLKKEGAKTDAETENIKADTNLTAEQILTQQQNTEVARATANEIGTRTRISIDKWAKEGLKIDEEISNIAAQTETEQARKDQLIADKLLKETMESYEKWKTDTASLRYWTSTGFYALASGLSQLINTGVNIVNIKNLFTKGLQKELKLPNPEVNLPNGVHKSEEVEFFDSLSEILETM